MREVILLKVSDHGITFVVESAQRAQDEYWHRDTGHRASYDAPATGKFKCLRCGASFFDLDDLQQHQQNEHSFRPPSIEISGIQQPHLISLRSYPNPQDVRFKDTVKVCVLHQGLKTWYEAADLNQLSFPDLPKRFDLILYGSSAATSRHIVKFDQEEPEAIHNLSSEFIHVFAKHEDFDWGDIISFEERHKSFGARNYCLALTSYLKGLKLKNGETDTDLATNSDFKESFNRSIVELKYHETQLSRVIQKLVGLSRRDFSKRFDCQSPLLDFTVSLFHELQDYGETDIQEPQTNIAGRPIAPTDKSIDFLFATMTSRHFDQIYESIRRAESDAKIHPSEIVLSKLFAIWKYSTIGNLDVSRFTRELSHNQQFALFFAKGQ